VLHDPAISSSYIYYIINLVRKLISIYKYQSLTGYRFGSEFQTEH